MQKRKFNFTRTIATADVEAAQVNVKSTVEHPTRSENENGILSLLPASIADNFRDKSEVYNDPNDSPINIDSGDNISRYMDRTGLSGDIDNVTIDDSNIILDPEHYIALTKDNLYFAGQTIAPYTFQFDAAGNFGGDVAAQTLTLLTAPTKLGASIIGWVFKLDKLDRDLGPASFAYKQEIKEAFDVRNGGGAIGCLFIQVADKATAFNQIAAVPDGGNVNVAMDFSTSTTDDFQVIPTQKEMTLEGINVRVRAYPIVMTPEIVDIINVLRAANSLEYLPIALAESFI